METATPRNLTAQIIAPHSNRFKKPTEAALLKAYLQQDLKSVFVGAGRVAFTQFAPVDLNLRRVRVLRIQ